MTGARKSSQPTGNPPPSESPEVVPAGPSPRLYSSSVLSATFYLVAVLGQHPMRRARRYHRAVANRLAGETSPYLLQHAHNPVDWYPWGPDALARAKLLDRPIFLSIGYAACHWCHVMERESFEHEPTARLPERSLRLDQGRPRGAARPRPDLHGRGPGDDRRRRLADVGLPDADGRPFYGGTYFPDEPRHGMPSFRQVLEGVSGRGARTGAGVEAAGSRLVASARPEQRAGSGGRGDPIAGAARCRDCRDRGDVRCDERRVGPRAEVPAADDDRVPAPPARRDRRRAAAGDGPSIARRDGRRRRSTTSSVAGSIATRPTRAGSCPTSSRCSTTTPSSRGCTSTRGRSPATRAIATVATGDARLHAPRAATADGAFAASQDADTDGVEGLTFTWRATEIARGPRRRRAPLFEAAYGVTEAATGKGVTILSRVVADDRARRAVRGSGRGGRGATCARPGERLLARRAERPQPARDDKALAAWNGLAIAAFADAAVACSTRRSAASRPVSRRPRLPPRRSSPACSRPTARSGGHGRTAGRSGRASSRTTRTSPTACLRCTRRPSTSAGSPSPAA